MKKRTYLLAIHVLSFFHKLRHDFIREFVVALCSGILLSLFYYVFNDFLNFEVRKISPKMRDDFAQVLAWVLLLAAAFSAGRLIRSFFSSPRSLFQTARCFGEDTSTRRLLASFHILLIFAFLYGTIWYVVIKVLVSWSLLQALSYSAIMALLSLGSSLIPELDATEAKSWNPSLQLSSLQAMVRWRLRMLFTRNRVAQFSLGLFVLCALVMLALSYLALPFLAAFVIAFWGGFLGACALCFQFGEDIQASWLEKSSGVSHKLYMDTLYFVSVAVGTLLGIVQALMYLLGSFTHDSTTYQNLAEALRIFFITGIPCWIVPAVLFQIDARRVLIPILTSFLVGIFTATAVFASWFAVALLALIAYYGYTSQDGRFYRA